MPLLTPSSCTLSDLQLINDVVLVLVTAHSLSLDSPK